MISINDQHQWSASASAISISFSNQHQWSSLSTSINNQHEHQWLSSITSIRNQHQHRQSVASAESVISITIIINNQNQFATFKHQRSAISMGAIRPVIHTQQSAASVPAMNRSLYMIFQEEQRTTTHLLQIRLRNGMMSQSFASDSWHSKNQSGPAYASWRLPGEDFKRWNATTQVQTLKCLYELAQEGHTRNKV